MLPYYGQSNLDLSIQLTGSIDSIVSLCNKNGVTDLNIVAQKYEDENTVLNPANIGYRYATQNKSIVVTSGDYDLSDYSPEDYT